MVISREKNHHKILANTDFNETDRWVINLMTQSRTNKQWEGNSMFMWPLFFINHLDLAPSLLLGWVNKWNGKRNEQNVWKWPLFQSHTGFYTRFYSTCVNDNARNRKLNLLKWKQHLKPTEFCANNEKNQQKFGNLDPTNYKSCA